MSILAVLRTDPILSSSMSLDSMVAFKDSSSVWVFFSSSLFFVFLPSKINKPYLDRLEAGRVRCHESWDQSHEVTKRKKREEKTKTKTKTYQLLELGHFGSVQIRSLGNDLWGLLHRFLMLRLLLHCFL